MRSIYRRIMYQLYFKIGSIIFNRNEIELFIYDERFNLSAGHLLAYSKYHVINLFWKFERSLN